MRQAERLAASGSVATLSVMRQGENLAAGGSVASATAAGTALVCAFSTGRADAAATRCLLVPLF